MRHGCQQKIGPRSVLLGKEMGLWNGRKCARWVWVLVLSFGPVLVGTIGGCGGGHQAPSSELSLKAVEKEVFPESQPADKTPPLESPRTVAGPEVSVGLKTPGQEEEVLPEKEAASVMPTAEVSQNIESARRQEQTAGIELEQSAQPAARPVVSETASPTEPLSSPAELGDEEGPAPSGRKEEESLKLGPPLVDHPERLQLLHPQYLAWIDPVERVLVLVGEVCQQDVPLELFACSGRSKAHESVVWVSVAPYVVHAGLLALGAEAGSPVQFDPEFRPPTGSLIEITVRWEEDGVRREVRAQDWVQDISGMYRMFEAVVANQFEDELHPHDQWDAWRSMDYPWVFAGSQFARDERTGREIYLADLDGELICVANFATAVLDVPIESSAANAALMFRCFAERIPPIGTPVTLILRPASGRESPGQPKGEN